MRDDQQNQSKTRENKTHRIIVHEILIPQMIRRSVKILD